ncbi:MAG: hypothetical protein Q9167_002299 [Letrouitia subvulpina]
MASSRKRNRLSPPRNSNKDYRRTNGSSSPQTRDYVSTGRQPESRGPEKFAKEQSRRNQIQEAEQMREWVAKEDEFVLRQSKKKAYIRVKEGRARSIDWLAVTLDVIDPYKDLLEDEGDDTDIDIIDPAGVFEGLTFPQLQDLGKEIESFLTLESTNSNRKYWEALRVICNDYQYKLSPKGPQHVSCSSVSTDVDCLLTPKSSAELESLEIQVQKKLRSNEPIDVEYWEELLRSIKVYSAKAALNQVYKSIINSRLKDFRQRQSIEALHAKEKLSLLLASHDYKHVGKTPSLTQSSEIKYAQQYDPEPLLRLRSEDKSSNYLKESDFLESVTADRRRVQRLGYIPPRQLYPNKLVPTLVTKPSILRLQVPPRFSSAPSDDFSQATTALYEREVARGVQENEEIFAGEEEVNSFSKPQWAGKYRPRKPRYFNRVQMGYEWNKYNQTHYDHDNPPPKVVQGYKFNIFYPDLIDKTKAPTYRIERENGRKRGQSFAPAGEEDTCLIRFVSGPPYEDLAFRIVDKEWDYSAKRERGFRSSFDKGILQLHFQFKKVYYRK